MLSAGHKNFNRKMCLDDVNYLLAEMEITPLVLFGDERCGPRGYNPYLCYGIAARLPAGMRHNRPLKFTSDGSSPTHRLPKLSRVRVLV